MIFLQCGFNFIFYIANLFYLITGAALIAIGVIIIYAAKEMKEYLTRDINFEYLPKYIIPIGVILIGIAIFGYVVWCLFSSICLIMTLYIISIGLLLILTIVISTLVLCLYPAGDNKLKELLKQHQSTYKENDNSRNFWDQLQNLYICCGVENRTDWLEYMPEPPPSCCDEQPDKDYKFEDPICTSYNKKKPYLQFIGCLKKIMQIQKKYHTSFIILACIACCAQGLCFVLSIITVIT